MILRIVGAQGCSALALSKVIGSRPTCPGHSSRREIVDRLHPHSRFESLTAGLANGISAQPANYGLSHTATCSFTVTLIGGQLFDCGTPSGVPMFMPSETTPT